MPTSLGIVRTLIRGLGRVSVADKPRTSRCPRGSVADITDCDTSPAACQFIPSMLSNDIISTCNHPHSHSLTESMCAVFHLMLQRGTVPSPVISVHPEQSFSSAAACAAHLSQDQGILSRAGNSLISLKSNERLGANRSGRSWHMSDLERFTQVAYDKWANEPFAQKFCQKNLKSYFLVSFIYVFLF